jgi:hypothetical protein
MERLLLPITSYMKKMSKPTKRDWLIMPLTDECKARRRDSKHGRFSMACSYCYPAPCLGITRNELQTLAGLNWILALPDIPSPSKDARRKREEKAHFQKRIQELEEKAGR